MSKSGASAKRGESLLPLAVCIAAGMFYGFANYLSGKWYLPGCSFAELRPQVAVPMFVGLLYGPAAGFLTGCLGDSFGYLFAGHGIDHAWNWSIGNGLIGMIPGFARSLGITRIKSIRDFQWVLALIVLASSLPILFALGLDRYRVGSGGTGNMLYSLFLPIFITDAVFGVVLAPLMLLAARRMVVTIETRAMLAVTYLLVLTILCTYAGSIWATWGSKPDVLAVRDLYTIGIVCLVVLVVGLAVSSLLTGRITGPLTCLTKVADSVGRGEYEQAGELAALSERPDELGRLAAVFQAMARDVRAREQSLKSEVRELRIEIDKVKQSREVAKITGTDYFRKLRERADDMRMKS